MKVIKIEIEEGNGVIQGKIYRLYAREEKIERSDKIRIVHYCKCFEPIIPNGDLRPTMLEHHCKCYDELDY